MLLALSLFGTYFLILILSTPVDSAESRLIANSITGSGTLLCGLAGSMDVLIAARAIAGMGGGG